MQLTNKSNQKIEYVDQKLYIFFAIQVYSYYNIYPILSIYSIFPI